MENVMRFFADKSRRLKKLLDSLDKLIGLAPKEQKKVDELLKRNSQADSENPLVIVSKHDRYVYGKTGRFSFDERGQLVGYHFDHAHTTNTEEQDLRDSARAVSDQRRAVQDAVRALADAQRGLRDAEKDYRSRKRHDASE